MNSIAILIKFIIEFGLILFLLSLTVSIYTFIKNKRILKSYMAYTTLPSIIITVASLIINKFARFNIDFSDLKINILIGYISAITTFILVSNINKNKK